MTGGWLSAIARRLLRPSTYDAIAAPAIADLQFESGAHARRAPRAYIGVIRGLTLAVLSDLRADLGVAFARSAVGAVWARAITWYAGFAVLTSVAIGMGLEPGTLSRAERTALNADVAVSLLPVIMAGAAFGLARRAPHSRRAIVLATVVTAIACFAIATATRPERNMLLANVAIADHGREPLLGPRTWATDLRTAVAVPAWALIGTALASSQGWMVLVRALLTAGGWSLLALTTLQMSVMQGWPEPHQRWRDLVLLFILGAVSLALPARRRVCAAGALFVALVPGIASADSNLCRSLHGAEALFGQAASDEQRSPGLVPRFAPRGARHA